MEDLEMLLKKEIVHRVDHMDQIKVQKNLVYRLDDSESSLMDIYGAYNAEFLAPVVILVHGEGKALKNIKDVGQYRSMGKLIAASGLNAVTFNHRVLSDGFSIREVIQDIDDLINYVINNAEKLGVDKNRIAIWSFSAGVPFGLYVGMSNCLSDIKCIIAYYGFGEFNYMGRFFSVDMDAAAIDKYSLLKLMRKNAALIPPLLVARAGLDNEILNESMDKFIAEAFRNNLSIDVMNHPAGEHAFDLLDDNSRTHEIIDKSLDFLKLQLKTN